MTKDQDFKALIRSRVAKTGESYTAARKQLLAERTRPQDGGLACGRCGEPIVDAEGYRRHLETVHGRRQSASPFDRDAFANEVDDALADLEEALRACPVELWEASMWHVPRTDPWVWPADGVDPIAERTDQSIQRFSAVWAVAYHCLWFLDFYVRTDPAGFESPEYVRGGPEEQPWPADGAAPLPAPVFSRDVLLRYLDHGRRQLRQRIAAVSDEELDVRCVAGHPRAGATLRELLGVNRNHVREHTESIRTFLADHGTTVG